MSDPRRGHYGEAEWLVRRRQPNRGRHRAPQSGAGVARACAATVESALAMPLDGSARLDLVIDLFGLEIAAIETAEALDLRCIQKSRHHACSRLSRGEGLREARGRSGIVPCRRQRSGRTEDGGRRCPLTLVVRHRPHMSLGLRPGSQASVSLRSTPLQHRHRGLLLGGTVPRANEASLAVERLELARQLADQSAGCAV